MFSEISTKYLHYQKLPRSFFAEISELPGKQLPLRRLYPDACDEGLDLVSHKTGAKITMYLDHIGRDAEGDVVAWVFKPVDHDAPISGFVVVND